MTEHGYITVQGATGRICGPNIARRSPFESVGGRKVVVFFVGSERRKNICEFRPSTESRYTGRKRDSHISIKPFGFTIRSVPPLEMENKLDKREAEICTGAITSYEDLGSRYWFMEGIWWWVEEGKISNENIEQGSWKRMLRGKSVTNRDASASS